MYCYQSWQYAQVTFIQSQNLLAAKCLLIYVSWKVDGPGKIDSQIISNKRKYPHMSYIYISGEYSVWELVIDTYKEL